MDNPHQLLARKSVRKSTALQAIKWRKDFVTPYNQAILRLVYNALNRRLRSLAASSFDESIRQHCEAIVEENSLLWSSLVFHWNECRKTVLGELPSDRKLREAEKKKIMTKKPSEAKVSRRTRKRRRERAERDAAIAAALDTGSGMSKSSNVHARRAGDKDFTPSAPLSSKTKDKPDNSESLNIRGGHQKLITSFNPSAINDHGAGDADLTLVDASPLKGLWIDKDKKSNDATSEYHEIECYGVDIFRAVDKRGIDSNRHSNQAKDIAKDVGPQRSLLDVYADHRELKLDGLNPVTLGLAGQTAKQVALEATYEFLQKCIPAANRKRLWTQLMGKKDLQDDQTISLLIPEGSMSGKGGSRSVDLLISNCIKILSSSFDTHDAKTLKAVFNRSITLCDALDDTRRRDALQRALNTLDWLVLGLSVKETQLYRAMSLVLIDEYDARYLLTLDEKGQIVISEERKRKERDLLRRYKDTYDGFKEPFQKGFVEMLQRLMAMEE